MTDFDSELDRPMDSEEQARAGSLTYAELNRIDEVLLSHATQRFQKVAMLIYVTMRELREKFPNLPDVFYASRVKHLVASGRLEAAGNLDRMRFSEVQLPQKMPSAEQ
jgi:hypothetical protein